MDSDLVDPIKPLAENKAWSQTGTVSSLLKETNISSGGSSLHSRPYRDPEVKLQGNEQLIVFLNTQGNTTHKLAQALTKITAESDVKLLHIVQLSDRI